MNRIFFGVLAMATVVVASNILVQFLILDGLLTWGAFTYPLAFLVTDVMNRVYGPASARKVVFAGLVVGIICSLIGSQIMLQGDGFEYPAVALRIAIGSANAFLIAQLLDIIVFNRLRDGSWWKAPLGSTLVGSTVDTVIFFSIAFAAVFNGFSASAAEEVIWAQDAVPFLNSGPMVPLWVSLAVADWGVKLSIALLALIPFRYLVARLVMRGAQNTI
ncbi:MAG: queuosine precursor transporter [Yoonia sp.]|uniref:queuosine precursor transporter n=1 Tax=Yoonia sp. TaxID=2212373 RepID=UPI003EF3BA96